MEVEKEHPSYARNLQKQVSHGLEEMIRRLFDDWDATRKAEYWMPILANVAVLPKDELAAMAESLVNLTKFKRRASLQQETVGGPIDVAVITKGDGFVWVKRKHYFRAELNPRFMSRYQRRKEND